ncbi:MAG: serine hydrolase [Gemmatimonadales bacterium]|nr:serine hydrolase [Gemmatimonadales bacterium]NIN10854.1 serine hydrolase [Gemmatimonadales bacterium]NIR02862.1 serine hydrolase [Gemmatimonadales bacterium]NIS66496.1 serine hydrolase [Gemmatimonadales bacterium]
MRNDPRNILFPLAVLLLAAPARPIEAQQPARGGATQLREALQSRLSALYAESRAPGVSVGIVLADGTSFGLAAGLADTVLGVPMTPSSRLLQGSVGKTYVAAVAMQLVHEGLLDPGAKISTYLGREPWFARLPNHSDVTVRQLMNHTSGIVRYEFNERFISDLLAAPDRVWQPEELLAYLFDTEAPFAAGEGWDYSDTNYIILGIIIERLTGGAYYDELRRRILEPLGLENTVPSNSRRVPGLVQGYAGVENLFGVPDAVIVDGEFAINPQFEWTGGGIASTAEDLARWGKALYEGRAFDESLLPVMVDGVDARLGPNTRYGLGVIIRPSPLGKSWGHSGFFPGYLTEMAYFPEHRVSVAVQLNSSDFPNLGMRPLRILLEMAKAAVQGGGAPDADSLGR